MNSSASSSLLLVLPVPFRQKVDGLYFEQQACNGLENWLNNFESVVVAAPVMPSFSASHNNVIRWMRVDEIIGFDRLRFISLTWAYSPLSFARNHIETRVKLSELINESRYLSFAIGSLFGDWAAIAALEAKKLGKNFVIDHFGGIVISGYASFGDNCRIRNGAVVGLRRVGEPCAPQIGDNVDIGAGAKLLGNIRIGNNVAIGANAVVLCDVPDDHVAYGVPAVVKPRRSTGGDTASSTNE
jgi:serine acetyltransferase